MKYLLIVFFALPTAALAQEPQEPQAKIILNAPEEARVGELVRFDVSESVADSFKWIMSPKTQDFLTFDEGAQAVFSARSEGRYRFTVACAKNGTVDVVTHTVTVEGPPPMPSTDSLVEWIPFWFWAENLQKEDATRLAASFEKIATQMPAKPSDWIKRTAEANREALGESIDAWEPLLDKIGKALRKRAEQGNLSTPEQHKEAWLEVAEGLRRV